MDNPSLPSFAGEGTRGRRGVSLCERDTFTAGLSRASSFMPCEYTEESVRDKRNRGHVAAKVHKGACLGSRKHGTQNRGKLESYSE